MLERNGDLGFDGAGTRGHAVTAIQQEDGLIGWRAVALLLLLAAILLALVAAYVSRAHF
jgi:hypothetical protein